MGQLWNFLNSPAGQGLITILVGLVLRHTVKSKTRQELIAEFAVEAFDAVEGLARVAGLKGEQKWIKFLELISQALHEAGKSKLTTSEIALLRNTAKFKAMAKK